MDLQLTDEVAVILGAGRGLGFAIAAGFLAEGGRVAIVDRDADSAAILARLPADLASHASVFEADVTDLDAMQKLARSVEITFGQCKHLVFAAGIGSGQFGFPFWNVDPKSWENVLKVNLIGAVNAAHVFAPAMAAAGSGTMLFIASVAGQIGSQTDPPYSASKAGLINFAQCAAKDLAPLGVRVNALCPGMVRTTLNRAVYESWAARQPDDSKLTYEAWADEKVRTIVPLKRWQTPEDIADMAVFLASPRAANVTGQTINVDGGYVMHC